jgi:hypothetical protein
MRNALGELRSVAAANPREGLSAETPLPSSDRPLVRIAVTEMSYRRIILGICRFSGRDYQKNK